MKRLTLFALLFPLLTIGQETGIHFEHGVSWNQVKAKAKAENKFIFMDCYTTLSSPCRFMSENIFPLKDVGDSINGKFISVKVQLDVSMGDNEDVKNWYAEGQHVVEKYNIKTFPTYLFFDPNATLVHRAIDSGSAEIFLSKVKNALDPETQFYTLLHRYKSGQKDTTFLRKIAFAAHEANENKDLQNIMGTFLHVQKDNIYKKENLEIIDIMTTFSSDKGFEFMMQHADKMDPLLGNSAAEQHLANIIIVEEIANTKPEIPYKKPTWLTMTSYINQYFPDLSAKALAMTKLKWYENCKEWNNYQIAVSDYMKLYSTDISIKQLDEYARTIFLHSNDNACLQEALGWSDQCCKSKDTSGINNLSRYINTYANLLYKLGQKGEAILYEQKAIDGAVNEDLKNYRHILDKMKLGQKTWDL